ncbi:MAG: type VI secretion system membrane subunit TssM, partial [Acidobacteriota bacterium]
EGWKEFLALLSKYRKRRPVNGIVLTISAQDLMTQGDGGREAHVEAARRRLTELTRELRIQPPVYLMVTKCDMVAGFADYFDDLTHDGRTQVWGVTFPYEQTVSGHAPSLFPAEFDELMVRLNSRVLARVAEQRGPRRRAAAFAFPQQMAALREALTQFVGDAFSSTRFDRPILLRGVYFTSGTQDGTQIDRLLGAVGRRFGVAPEAVAPQAGRGKSYFVEQLLKDVVIGESGLAGVNRRLELKKAAWQLGAYAAIVTVVVVGFIALSVSYANNQTYVAQVASDVALLQRVPPLTPGASIEAFLPRLNAGRAVADSANRYRDDIPWGMRWGLYQGASVGVSARDAYLRELDSIVLPRFAARLKQHVIEYGSDPQRLYVYLKAYLMLGDPRHLDKKSLQRLADLEWKMPGTAAGTSLATHFRSLLDDSETLRPIALDQLVVRQARSAIGPASIPKIIYGELQRLYDGEREGALHLDVISLGIEKVLKRKSQRKLSEPVPALYTLKVFRESTGTGMVPLVKKFAEEEWVWGAGGVPGASSIKLPGQVTDLYEKDYIQVWDALLADLEIQSFATDQQYAEALEILGAPTTSPLRGILKTVVENTSFTPPASAAAPTSLVERMEQRAKDLANAAQEKVTGLSSVPPGTAVTLHFQPIHQIMAGAPPPIDAVLEQIRQLREQLLKLGPQAGGASPLKAIADPAFRDRRRALEASAESLPHPVNTLVAQIAQHVGEGVQSAATGELEKRYDVEVVAQCRARVAEHYPFGAGTDMPLSDFGEVFGYGGLYDRFFTELDPLVDKLQRPWAWRLASVDPSTSMLTQFQRVERIRQMFFSPGAKTPELRFDVSLSNLTPPATRFYFYVDGQDLDVRPGAERKKAFTWPGPKPGLAYATFEDDAAPPDRAFGSDSPWAWFRVIDAVMPAQAQPEGNLVSVLQFQRNSYRAQVTIDASNASSNPFTARDWQKFRCEP